MKLLSCIFLLLVSTTLIESSIFKRMFKQIKEVFTSDDNRSHKWIDGKKPWFCHDNECPKFTIKKKFKSDGIDIQERCYDESVWVSTAGTGPHTGSTSFRSMFKKLFNYISGENDQKKKVPMTSPVLVQVSLDKNIKDTLDIKMNFFAPPETVETLPNPSASDVKISSLPKMCVYVYSYGGWQMSVNKSLKNKVDKLRNALKKAGLEGQYDEESMMFAGYDSPWKLFKRHNEVMVRKIETEDIVIKQ